MLRRMFASSVLVVASGGILACGGAETSNGAAIGTMSASLKGSVANPKSVPLGKSVHAAVVWHTASGFSVGENVAVQGTDASFALDLVHPPPASALMPASNFGAASAAWPASTKIAVGTVVAYDDSNGNTTLDLSQSGTTSADGIVASNSAQVLVYVDGPLPGTEASQGYNLVAYGSDCAGPPLLTAAGSVTSNGPVTGSGDEGGSTLSTAPSSGPVTGSPPLSGGGVGTPSSGSPYLFPGLCAAGTSLSGSATGTPTTANPSGPVTGTPGGTSLSGPETGTPDTGTSLTATTGNPSGPVTGTPDTGTSLTATTGNPSGPVTGIATTGNPPGAGCGTWGTTSSPIVLTVAPYPAVPSSMCGGVTQAP